MPALDGIRGVAAAVVVVHHLSLVARPFLESDRIGSAWWWINETPFKVFSAGTEAVLVFFVLSGLVVALPPLTEGFSWLRYYATRLLRLYLPVWGALLFATALILLIPRDASAVTDDSWTENTNSRSVSPGVLLGEASLVLRTYHVDNVLWSLRWEIIFSLLLPLFVILAVLVRRWWAPAAVVTAALAVTGRVIDLDALMYLPVFFLGTIIAVRLPEILEGARRRSTRFWWVLTIVSLVLVIGNWLARHVFPSNSTGKDVLLGLAAVGAAGLIIAALGFPVVRDFLSTRIPQWLGRVSFSLYLVHVPVIATVAYLVGDERWWLVAIISVPVSLVVAQLFFSAVERPSHRFARWVGSAVPARRSSGHPTSAEAPPRP